MRTLAVGSIWTCLLAYVQSVQGVCIAYAARGQLLPTRGLGRAAYLRCLGIFSVAYVYHSDEFYETSSLLSSKASYTSCTSCAGPAIRAWYCIAAGTDHCTCLFRRLAAMFSKFLYDVSVGGIAGMLSTGGRSLRAAQTRNTYACIGSHGHGQQQLESAAGKIAYGYYKVINEDCEEVRVA